MKGLEGPKTITDGTAPPTEVNRSYSFTYRRRRNQSTAFWSKLFIFLINDPDRRKKEN